MVFNENFLEQWNKINMAPFKELFFSNTNCSIVNSGWLVPNEVIIEALSIQLYETAHKRKEATLGHVIGVLFKPKVATKSPSCSKMDP